MVDIIFFFMDNMIGSRQHPAHRQVFYKEFFANRKLLFLIFSSALLLLDYRNVFKTVTLSLLAWGPLKVRGPVSRD